MTFDREDIPAIADDYVLGLLEASDAEAIEAAMERDGELRAAIAKSRERFLPLDTGVEPAAVNGELWNNIESRLPP
ncbi:MAG: anti-sigma factor, partial [Rhizobium oryzihabitans]